MGAAARAPACAHARAGTPSGTHQRPALRSPVAPTEPAVAGSSPASAGGRVPSPLGGLTGRFRPFLVHTWPSGVGPGGGRPSGSGLLGAPATSQLSPWKHGERRPRLGTPSPVVCASVPPSAMRFLKGRLTLNLSLEFCAPTYVPLPPRGSRGSRPPRRPLPVRVWTREEATVSLLCHLSNSSAEKGSLENMSHHSAPVKNFSFKHSHTLQGLFFVFFLVQYPPKD